MEKVLKENHARMQLLLSLFLLKDKDSVRDTNYRIKDRYKQYIIIIIINISIRLY